MGSAFPVFWNLRNFLCFRKNSIAWFQKSLVFQRPIYKQPLSNRMKSKFAILTIQEVCFKRCSQVVDQFCPGDNPRPEHDFSECCSDISLLTDTNSFLLSTQVERSMLFDYINRTFRCLFKPSPSGDTLVSFIAVVNGSFFIWLRISPFLWSHLRNPS